MSHVDAEPAMPAERVLEVENLRIAFAAQSKTPIEVVRGVSFHIDRGETLALVGESGSGKSVTAMTLMRLTEHDGATITEGSIRLRGREGRVMEITRIPLDKMIDVRGADVSIVFQDPMSSLNPVFTVGEQICEAIVQHQGKSTREAEQIALKTLQLVRVPDAARRMKQYPHEFSGGMRQRVMIAMALSCKPSLLILDEPTTALDVTIQAQILDLVRSLQEEIGMSALFITHDMGVVAEVADRVCVMYNGALVEQGDVFSIFEAPRHEYTKALIAAVPQLGSMAETDMPAKFPLVEFSRNRNAGVGA
ncbi:ABC transporter ATP-binding protein [Nitratireductor aquimarinus]|uniref:ABC transporter ATP-binding protein n=1 Tax=Nitratireductor TaxID=245876 RepID=UPI0019D3C716|nr:MULTISPECIES: ABC transporter ATP-binding protein [Nitratireductor]MBN7776343.1 ABC transporter ATP-binding protein [Nitratireductor pacificus]MBN7779210.1 ABC transporter ATP-binding protein [Nitratireductor pacificus]MBN7788017.1 ABC transporter ATP-binding protein [Nitratireductor aquimarinus]MBY6098064.1 ABC transporter ATP-binding protein [Nitratireductor aquimarinus]MCA1260087.1 ABC transporter ATP-binding protein [Nitratireductor aquimarinus]